MGWLDGKFEQRAAAAQAIRLAEGLALPFQAWSKTRKEVQRSDRRVVLFAVALYLAIVVPIALAARSEYEKDPVTVTAFVGGIACVGAVLVLLTWYWSGRSADIVTRRS